MNKDLLLRSLAENGYNVSFGARKNFATYDIVEKMPGWISLIGLIIGVLQIYADDFKYNNLISLILICVSIIGLQISIYNSDKERYRVHGEKLIQLHNQLRDLYYEVKSSNKQDFQDEKNRMDQIMNAFYSNNISKQIAFSDWYAHYKFFFQSQHEWINQEKRFTWRDKIPVSFRFFILTLIAIVVWVYLGRGMIC